jgi:hypothetical protein
VVKEFSSLVLTVSYIFYSNFLCNRNLAEKLHFVYYGIYDCVGIIITGKVFLLTIVFFSEFNYVDDALSVCLTRSVSNEVDTSEHEF